MSNYIQQEVQRRFLAEAWDTEIFALKAKDKLTCPLCATHPLWLPGKWLSELTPALEAKCPVCTIIYHAVMRIQRSNPDLSRVRATRATVLDLLLVSPRNRSNLEHAAKKNSDVEVFTMSGQVECELAVVGVRGDLHADRAESCIPVVRAWLENCERNHPACVAGWTVLPTRVIDVGAGEEGYVKLCVGGGECASSAPRALRQELFDCHSYLILTRGSIPTDKWARTTTTNLSRRLSKIHLVELPRCFQEAIAVTRALDLRYLWIDSLCIIQDDLKDWQAESSRMATVYNDAHLVLGASCAEASSHSFITPTRRSAPDKLIARVENSDGSIATVYARESRPHGDLVGPRFSRSEYIANRPLATRGWALQEQLLSTRMVHFEAEELFWECRTMMECECLELRDANEYKTALETDTKNGKLRLWHSLVEQYHLRHLSFASDFLPALAGIITHLEAAGAGPNVAGLWQRQLLYELLWRAGPNSMLWQRAVPYRAPTWSWASIHEARKDRTFNGYRIEHWVEELGRPDPCYSSLNAYSIPIGTVDSNGGVSGGELHIRGKLLKMRETRPTTYSVPHGERNMQITFIETRESFERGLECFVDVTEDDYTTMDLYAVLLAHFPKKSREEADSYLQWDDHWSGLILRCLGTAGMVDSGGSEVRYERVGAWKLRERHSAVHDADSDVEQVRTFAQLFQGIDEADLVVI